MPKPMGRPKNIIEKKVINTKIDKNIASLLRKKSKDTGIPINRLIEDALREKYEVTKK